jgi:hypothetical protein
MLAIIASMSAHPCVTNRTNANLLCRQHNEHLVADLAASTTSKLSRRHDEYLHDDHFHVRIGCPRGDDQCRAGVRAPPRPARRRAQRAELRRGEVARARTPARR